MKQCCNGRCNAVAMGDETLGYRTIVSIPVGTSLPFVFFRPTVRYGAAQKYGLRKSCNKQPENTVARNNQSDLIDIKISWFSPISIRQEIGNVSVSYPFDIVLPDIIHAHNVFRVMVADGKQRGKLTLNRRV